VDSTILDLGEDLSGFLATLGQPIEQTAREMIVFELYRRSLVSSGKAAELLGIPRLEFIQRTSELGIPYFRFTETNGRRKSQRAKESECRSYPIQVRSSR
jgi:predicted HTH domain antitoxin